jgi:hypothetical protein
MSNSKYANGFLARCLISVLTVTKLSTPFALSFANASWEIKSVQVLAQAKSPNLPKAVPESGPNSVAAGKGKSRRNNLHSGFRNSSNLSGETGQTLS